EKELGADDAVVSAVQHRLGDWKALRMEGSDDAVLAIHGVCRGQQLSRRLPPQHLAAQRGFDQIGRIGLTALELAHHQWTGNAYVITEKGLKPRHIEAQPLGDLAGAGKGALAVYRRHGGILEHDGEKSPTPESVQAKRLEEGIWGMIGHRKATLNQSKTTHNRLRHVFMDCKIFHCAKAMIAAAEFWSDAE